MDPQQLILVAETDDLQRYVQFRHVLHLASGCSVGRQVQHNYSPADPFYHLHRPSSATDRCYHLDSRGTADSDPASDSNRDSNSDPDPDSGGLEWLYGYSPIAD